MFFRDPCLRRKLMEVSIKRNQANFTVIRVSSFSYTKCLIMEYLIPSPLSFVTPKKVQKKLKRKYSRFYVTAVKPSSKTIVIQNLFIYRTNYQKCSKASGICYIFTEELFILMEFTKHMFVILPCSQWFCWSIFFPTHIM